ncbi:MAG: DUF2510 domain-containing protein [Acidimicrobiia bacterium]|nr:DUF2510 domain-containing protein [Acidimicrobiia bacterium]
MSDQPTGSWQPDPEGRFRLRWWDGSAWTAQVSDGTTTSVDPAFGSPGAPPTDAPPSGAGRSGSKLPLLLLALVVVGGAVAAFLLLSGGDDVDPAADAELVDDAILTLDDLPDGFQETEADDDEDDDSATEVCNEELLGIDRDTVDELTTAEAGPVQFDTEAASIRAQITAFRSGEVPTRILDALSDDAYRDCVEEEFAAQLEEDAELQGIDEIDPAVEVDGAVSSSLRFEIEITAGDTIVGVESEQHIVLVDGRFGIVLQVTAEAGELDADLVEDAMRAMLDRLEAGRG